MVYVYIFGIVSFQYCMYDTRYYDITKVLYYKKISEVPMNPMIYMCVRVRTRVCHIYRNTHIWFKLEFLLKF